LYFSNAAKIVAIADRVKEEHQKLFKLDDSKYLVINNSLDFSKYPDKKNITIPKKYKKLLLFGRVSELKRNSIETAIDFYDWCRENYNSDMELTIVGDGEILDEIKEKYKEKNIIFKGAVLDINKEIEDKDILLGVDRCALESVASKKPSIICGYNNNVSLITPKNIKKCIKENFGGYSLTDNKEELFKLKAPEIKKIIEQNYSIVKKELSIDNSSVLNIKNDEFEFNTLIYFEDLNKLIRDIEEEKRKVEDANRQIELLNNKINDITSSKRWKMIDKVGNLKNKIRRRR
jgi:glycosyltransferase involved in cell wall biosynthesis